MPRTGGFALDPLTGRPLQVTIKAAHGLGTAVVEGEAPGEPRAWACLDDGEVIELAGGGSGRSGGRELWLLQTTSGPG